MKLMKNLALGLFAVMFAFNTLAATVEVKGVKFPDSIDLHGNKLQLNGAGTRYKYVFKVYAAGLYLGKKTNSVDEVINQPGPKRMSITMLRNIDAREFGKMFTRGMEDNMGKAAMSRLIPGLIRTGEIFAAQKSMVPGDTILLEWVPGVGTVVTAKGENLGTLTNEPEFFKAIMMIWLGPVPADVKLKDALLGLK